jgi:hypothetical protein
MLPALPKSSESRAIMLLNSRDSEHVQVWLDHVFAEQVDVKPGGFVAQSTGKQPTAVRFTAAAQIRKFHVW